MVDIDHLDSYEEAVRLRGQLFADPYLLPRLAFVSPSGRGVKIFVPYDPGRVSPPARNAAESVYWLMAYVQQAYGTPGDPRDKGVDTSGKDLVRACFLSHDEGALLRE